MKSAVIDPTNLVGKEGKINQYNQQLSSTCLKQKKKNKTKYISTLPLLYKYGGRRGRVSNRFRFKFFFFFLNVKVKPFQFRFRSR